MDALGKPAACVIIVAMVKPRKPTGRGGTSRRAADAKNETRQPAAKRPAPSPKPGEVGGPSGPEPTRYGDWQHKGRVTDF